MNRCALPAWPPTWDVPVDMVLCQEPQSLSRGSATQHISSAICPCHFRLGQLHNSPNFFAASAPVHHQSWKYISKSTNLESYQGSILRWEKASSEQNICSNSPFLLIKRMRLNPCLQAWPRKCLGGDTYLGVLNIEWIHACYPKVKISCFFNSDQVKEIQNPSILLSSASHQRCSMSHGVEYKQEFTMDDSFQERNATFSHQEEA